MLESYIIYHPSPFMSELPLTLDTSFSDSCHIGLINPKNATNVGAIIRAAGCYSVNSILFTGDRFKHSAKYQLDTQNISNTIPLTSVEDILSCASEKLQTVCVELAVGATSLPSFRHPDHALYIFGPEDGSIKQATVDQADHVVYIPTIGCMNLAATVNVVLYDRMAKNHHRNEGDALVIHSRDRNNNLKVKRD